MREVPVPLVVDRDRLRTVMARQGVVRAPLSGQWEITWRCNLRCVHCYTDPWNTPDRVSQELTTAEVLRILDELQEAGCLSLTLTGGDPLARPDFREIYRAAAERGFLLTVFTNGTLITEGTIDLWRRYPPEKVEVTLNGITASVYEAVTAVAGSYTYVMRGIRLVHEAGIPLVVKANAMTLNVGELLAIKAFVRTLSGVAFKMSEEIFERLDGSHDSCALGVDPESLRALEEADPELREGKRKKDEEEARPAACGGGDTTFHIDPLGRLQRCSRNRRGSYDLRRGTFREGFERFLPTFPCPNRPSAAAEEVSR